jgi:DNA-binding MarR family transcriptional regulator
VNQLHNEQGSTTVKAPPEVTPDDALGRLFELAVVLFEAMEDGLAERRLSRSRAEVLWRLYHQGPMTQRELSEALRCTPRNVTGLLDALQADGYATRGPHPTDRRASLASLTERGTATVAALDEEHHAAASYLFDGVSPADLTNLVATMDLVLARLRATGAGHPSSR